MSKKQPKKLLRIGEFAKATGARISTIKWYSEIGILPFEQAGARLTRRYDKEKAIRRLKKIRRFQEQGLSVEEIRKWLV